jgi:hypothetical protein
MWRTAALSPTRSATSATLQRTAASTLQRTAASGLAVECDQAPRGTAVPVPAVRVRAADVGTHTHTRYKHANKWSWMEIPPSSSRAPRGAQPRLRRVSPLAAEHALKHPASYRRASVPFQNVASLPRLAEPRAGPPLRLTRPTSPRAALNALAPLLRSPRHPAFRSSALAHVACHPPPR